MIGLLDKNIKTAITNIHTISKKVEEGKVMVMRDIEDTEKKKKRPKSNF